MGAETEDAPFTELDLSWEHTKNRAFMGLCFVSSIIGLVALAFLIGDVIWEATRAITVYETSLGHFLTSVGSVNPERAGFYAAMMGSIWLIIFTALIAFFVGVGAAIYLEEFAPDNRLTRLIEANLANLAGVPSVVYGLVCLGLLVNGPPDMGRIILVGAIALALLVMPIIIVSAMEALRAVPDSVRAGSQAIGATEWQTIRNVVLPAAVPGIMTGTILALARAIGETAPLLMVGALVGARHVPGGPFDRITAMTVTIFEWAFNFQDHFHVLAALGIAVLLVILLAMNGIAIYVRNRYETEI
ncbi:phosphate ABC transporter permease PstA [Natrarchaeobius sp. A-rgal3]|uniref:phosphate ABC transporter permease PstA n=1 Tax=Natrarchaeobius versutus TaxID=1679078 RepID=UPI00350F4A54